MPTPDVPDEIRYRLLAYLSERPEASQRELAAYLGVSLGKINYCLKSLAAKGWIKVRNFRRSTNKLGYVYRLTPKGIEEKLNVTYQFLRTKMREYDEIATEIERLRREVATAERGKS